MMSLFQKASSLCEQYRNAAFHKRLNRFALSPCGFILQLLTALLIVIFNFQINGVAIFGYIAIFMLILCSDLLTLALPLMLSCVFSLECYDSAEKFLSFIIPEAVILILALLFHFIVYKRRKRVGKSLSGLIAVSIPVTFSGLFNISWADYFSPFSLYYTLFLGFGMVGIYLILTSYSPENSDYDRNEMFMKIMYITGLFAAFCVFFHYIKSISDFIKAPGLLTFQSSNNLSTFLMICLPFAFYYTIKASKLNIISAAIMFLAIIASGSGGGLLMGTVLVFVCLVYLIAYDKKKRILWGVVSGVILLGTILLSGAVLKNYHFTSFDDIFYSNNMRISLLRRSLADFSANPIFGAGLCYTGNTDIYMPKAGAMNWYHMMIPQTIGSMGIAGIIAYGYQLVVRLRLVLSHFDTTGAALGLSYLGLFLMSQVNPGEFCPIPYSLIAVVIFIFIERRKECTFRQCLCAK